LGSELMDDFFGAKNPTLGETLLATKRRMAVSAGDGNPTSAQRPLLDAVAKVISPDPGALDAERREHLLLFNLLGDPLLRLPRPSAVRIEAPTHAVAGQSLQVSLTSELAGDCVVELVCRRDRLKEPPPERQYYDGRDRILAGFQQTYQSANNAQWCQQALRCDTGRCEVTLEVPAEARGNCHVRAYVRGAQQYALGSTDVFVRKPSAAGSAATTGSIATE
jgi:hypothetical protein